MKRISLIALLTPLVTLNGCAKDRSFAPPADNEYITVTVKVPDELVAEEMEVMYRSPVCKFTTFDSRGRRVALDGYKEAKMKAEQQGESDRYQTKLPIDGGGACKWYLSNVTFGVAYKEPSRFGEKVTYGTGGGVIVIFDHNSSPRGGADFKVEGDLVVKQDYYPWIDEGFLGPYKKTISLASEGYFYRIYQALQAREVYFEPVLHSGFVLQSSGPKVKKDGNYTSYTYPDGSVYADGRSHPNFLRLQTIRLKAESKN